MSHIPEFSKEKGGSYGKQFDIIWVGSQIPGGVNYKGYVHVGNNTYLIANLNNPRTGGIPGGAHYAGSPGDVINYATQDNFFARGRTNNSGSNAQISGKLYADGNNTYVPGNVITSDQQLSHGFEDPGYYYYDGWS